MTVLLATIVLLQGGASAVQCPVMGGAVVKGSETTDYEGIRFSYCCEGCRVQFEQDPGKYMATAAKGDKVIGVSLFDPVSRRRVDPAKAKGGSSDIGGVRYYFESADDKKTFDKDPAPYTAIPKQEALYCLVMKQPVSEYAKSSAYVDLDGVRYYFCCAGCDAKYAADPSAFAKNGQGKATKPKPMTKKAAASQAETFPCKHCGRTMRVKTAADLDRTCNVCNCSKTGAECKPGR